MGGRRCARAASTQSAICNRRSDSPVPLLLWNLLIHLTLPFLFVWVIAVSFMGRRLGASWLGQAGLRDLPAAPSGKETLWLHAASVGETRAVAPLVRPLKQRYPDLLLFLSVSTPEALELAHKTIGADLHGYFPFDFPWILRRWFRRLRPRACIIVETEIWPNFSHECRRRGIPLILASGRISPRSFRRSKSLAWAYRAFLDDFSLLLARSSSDRECLLALGADPERTHVSGDLKYESLPEPAPGRGEGSAPDDGAPFLLVGGSVHPGEERPLVEALKALKETMPDASLVLAPRHPEKAEAMAESARDAGLPAALRSEVVAPVMGGVLVVDRIGELVDWYGRADLVFVGGSLVPAGGHSLLEPAALGRPLLHGPHCFNFREAESLLLEAGGARRVEDGPELVKAVSALAKDPDARRLMGRSAREAVATRRGALNLTLNHLAHLLPPSHT